MKKVVLTVLLVGLSFGVVAEQPSGDYKNWRLLSISHRTDKQTLRAILGNDTAIESARAGKFNAWAEGSILAKVKWKESTHKNWAAAIVPGEFEAAEAMVKDSKKYTSTGGWGFGKWQEGNLVMFDEAKSKECFACHLAAEQKNDYVFTHSALQ
jgi:hypothetical protein